MFLRIFNPVTNYRALKEAWVFMRPHARLIYEMSKENIFGRYKGQFLGGFWVILHPLAITLLYLFLFGIVFAQRIGGTRELPLDYTTYILSGLIPWLTFQMAMSTSVTAVIANASLVKQFIFPIEILPIRDVASSLVIWFTGILATLIYVAASQHVFMATWALLPLVLLVQILAMLGVAFILSAVAVFFKDIKDFVQLFSLVAIFLMPVVFLPGWVPEIFRPIIWANPFTYMTWVYQDVIYFGRIAHPWAWVIFFAWSILAFTGGYRLFKRTKPMFGSLV
ncbi:MAG: ABC transporter permease [Desulfarculus sp.]|nr:ABC transporter permease [Pseudomonadota bacterium]MBV1716589.1 ABC transporter permease [Desulfarculus sp.]MBU4573226.1 ABC transporter permease [Pseudomonadota bacterium]MBU4597717.1 ABC transporter permease [Pseudomonadota bacterium]MBV1736757.1 ABC transporter permease [Desulfarculus sp.]